jgi:hypothetical protein
MNVRDIREITAKPGSAKAAKLWRKTNQPERRELYVRGLEKFLSLPQVALFEAIGADIEMDRMTGMLDELASLADARIAVGAAA